MSSITSKFSKADILNPDPSAATSISKPASPANAVQRHDSSSKAAVQHPVITSDRSVFIGQDPDHSTTSTSDRRPVAKKACLACREKKVKCDGEMQMEIHVPLPNAQNSNGGKAITTTSYNKCSNCAAAGLKCVYVASKRGGRRRKTYSNEANNSGLSVISVHTENTTEVSDDTNDERASNFAHNKRQFLGRHHQGHQNRLEGRLNGPDENEDIYDRARSTSNVLPSPPAFAFWGGSGAGRRIDNLPYLPPPQIKDGPVIDSEIASELSESSSMRGSGGSSYYPPYPRHRHPHHHRRMHEHDHEGDHGYGRGYMHGPPPPFHHFMPPSFGFPHPPPHPHQHPPPPLPPHGHLLHPPPPPGPFGHYGFPGYPPPPPPPPSMPLPTSQLQLSQQESDRQHYSNYESNKSGTDFPGHGQPLTARRVNGGSLVPSDSVTSIQAKRMMNEEDKSYSDTTEDWIKRQHEYQEETSQQQYQGHQNPPGSPSSRSASSIRAKDASERVNQITNTKNSMSLSNISHNYIDQSPSKNSAPAHRSEIKLSDLDDKPDVLPLPSRISEDELATFGLPDWKTTQTLIKMFYKYVHISHLVMPNISLFVNKLALNEETAAMIFCMFRMALKYISPNELSDASILNEDRWIQLGNQIRHDLPLRTELVVQTMSCYMGDDDQLSNCMRAIKANNYLDLLRSKTNAEYTEFVECSTERQLIDREIEIRLVWNVYKFHLFRRVNFGYPYKVESSLFKFPVNLELPMSDVDFYLKTRNPVTFRSTYKKTLNLNQININDPSIYVHDSVLLILCCRVAEEIMDAISRDALMAENILKLDSQIHRIMALKDIKPYTIDKSRGYILINGTILLANFINNLSSIILHSSLCKDMLLFHPKRAIDGACQLHMMDDLPTPMPTPDQIPTVTDVKPWKSLLNCMISSLNVIGLLELGEGICPETLDMNTALQTTVGPCSISDSETWFSLDPKLARLSTIQSTNETWVQYPLFCLSVVCCAIPIISSFILILKEHTLAVVDADEEENLKKIIVSRSGKVVTEWSGVSAELATAVEERFKPNLLLEKLRIACRYLESVSRYFGGVKVASIQAETLMESLLSV
ncbi:hypothetical protein CANARDRAFT_5181 [[Candida] arabinofermentans NRRL YB-2248]|uniref:Zn(2)-C6 fungal-type domain-containing protein n=1 Tax=[Candida] arabinofermentans NRRL YB-2248 TaxID=983967 RepID=A0A1E4T7Z1_9ASCO|nr:hypothetical protein CANARDRAFT_5181 [[Candida] arabinofermentans NRRL YB-2248]